MTPESNKIRVEKKKETNFFGITKKNSRDSKEKKGVNTKDKTKKKERKKEKKETCENSGKFSLNNVKDTKEYIKIGNGKPVVASNPSLPQDQAGYQCLFMAAAVMGEQAQTQERTNIDIKYAGSKRSNAPVNGNQKMPPQVPPPQQQKPQEKDDLYENLSIFRNG